MERKFKVVIVDDEPPARDILELFTSKVPFLECIATCSNAIQAINVVESQKPDLVLLDVNMPEMTGMELLSIGLRNRPDIIITTAYPNYALESYEFSVVDYLVKPISFDRFFKAVLKFKDKMLLSLNASNNISHPAVPLPYVSDKETVTKSNNEFVWLREEKKLLQVQFNDVLYVEGLKDYIKVFLKDKLIVTHMSIGKAEDLFLPPIFIRVHRSFIIRRSAIQMIDGNNVILTNNKEIQIGPNYRESLKKYISELR